MSRQTIRTAYGKTYYLRQRVRARGKLGIVTGGDERAVFVRLDGDRHAAFYDPDDVTALDIVIKRRIPNPPWEEIGLGLGENVLTPDGPATVVSAARDSAGAWWLWCRVSRRVGDVSHAPYHLGEIAPHRLESVSREEPPQVQFPDEIEEEWESTGLEEMSPKELYAFMDNAVERAMHWRDPHHPAHAGPKPPSPES